MSCCAHIFFSLNRKLSTVIHFEEPSNLISHISKSTFFHFRLSGSFLSLSRLIIFLSGLLISPTVRYFFVGDSNFGGEASVKRRNGDACISVIRVLKLASSALTFQTSFQCSAIKSRCCAIIAINRLSCSTCVCLSELFP